MPLPPPPPTRLDEEDQEQPAAAPPPPPVPPPTAPTSFTQPTEVQRLLGGNQQPVPQPPPQAAPATPPPAGPPPRLPPAPPPQAGPTTYPTETPQPLDAWDPGPEAMSLSDYKAQQLAEQQAFQDALVDPYAVPATPDALQEQYRGYVTRGEPVPEHVWRAIEEAYGLTWIPNPDSPAGGRFMGTNRVGGERLDTGIAPLDYVVNEARDAMGSSGYAEQNSLYGGRQPYNQQAESFIGLDDNSGIAGTGEPLGLSALLDSWGGMGLPGWGGGGGSGGGAGGGGATTYQPDVGNFQYGGYWLAPETATKAGMYGSHALDVQGRATPGTDYGGADQSRAGTRLSMQQQRAAAGMMQDQAAYMDRVQRGLEGPSLAELQMQQGTEDAIRGMVSAAQSGRSWDPGAQTQALRAGEAQMRQNLRDTAQLRAQEQLTARDLAGRAQQAYGTMTTDMATTGLEQQTRDIGRAEFLTDAELRAQDLRDKMSGTWLDAESGMYDQALHVYDQQTAALQELETLRQTTHDATVRANIDRQIAEKQAEIMAMAAWISAGGSLVEAAT